MHDIWEIVSLCHLFPFHHFKLFWITFGRSLAIYRASLVAQMVTNLSAVQETWVRFLGWEDPLEKAMATPVFFPGEFYGQRSLMGYSPQCCKGSNTTEWLTQQQCTMPLGRKAIQTYTTYYKAETLLCQQRSNLSKLWFFQWSCMDVRVGL